MDEQTQRLVDSMIERAIIRLETKWLTRGFFAAQIIMMLGIWAFVLFVPAHK
jgi:hypothetical protein